MNVYEHARSRDPSVVQCRWTVVYVPVSRKPGMCVPVPTSQESTLQYI